MNTKSVKLGGFGKNGQAILISLTTHHYSDLPMKGLGKSMDTGFAAWRGAGLSALKPIRITNF